MVSNTPQMTPEDQSDPELLRAYYLGKLEELGWSSELVASERILQSFTLLEEARAAEYDRFVKKIGLLPVSWTPR